MGYIGKHAIVIGASMGGLLAARALSDHFDQVTIVERDALDDVREPRKGVPQGRHTHGLLAGGLTALERLFPGFREDMVADGGQVTDLLESSLWYNYAYCLAGAPSQLTGVLISRPALEYNVRRRIARLANVCLAPKTEALALEYDARAQRATGLRVRPVGFADGGETLAADLVVDASGRGSQSPAWLQALGYDKPVEERVRVDIGYMTRLYRRRPEHAPGLDAVVVAACSPSWRAGAMLAQENDRWTVSIGGYFGDRAPADDKGFLEFARSLPRPEIYDVVRSAEPLSETMPYTFNASQRRRYEKLSRFPDGFLVFGDAMCSFNPIYGQGMTVAANEALALRDCLACGAVDLAQSFFAAARPIVDAPWQIAVGSDLGHPQVEGKRTPDVRSINWYIAKLFKAAQRDPGLALKFVEVANLMHPPSSLLSPATAWRVWRGQRAAQEATPAATPSFST